MPANESTASRGKKPLVYYVDGKIYFDRKVERGFYFFLTMLILVWGALMKLGVDL